MPENAAASEPTPLADHDEIRAVNAAAWMTSAGGPLQVAEAPYPVPGEDQIVVRNHALAINPLDWVIQVADKLAYRG